MPRQRRSRNHRTRTHRSVRDGDAFPNRSGKRRRASSAERHQVVTRLASGRTGSLRRSPPKPNLPIREKLLVAALLLWLAVTLFWYRAGLDWTGHTVSAFLGLACFLIAFAPDLRREKDQGGRPEAVARGFSPRVRKEPVSGIGGQWPADSGQSGGGRGQWAVDTGQEAVDSGQWTVSGGQGTVGRRRVPSDKNQEARTKSEEPTPLHPSSFIPHPSIRLLRFPPFWLGLMVLLVAGIQNWNTEWDYVFLGGGTSGLMRQDHVEWLPSGVEVPLNEQGNPYTTTLQIMLPWMMFCIVACGFTPAAKRRRRREKNEGERLKDEGARPALSEVEGRSEAVARGFSPRVRKEPVPGKQGTGDRRRETISASQRFNVSAFQPAWSWLANGALVITALWTLMALWHYYTGQEKLYGFIEIGRSNRPPYWGTVRDPNHGAFLQMMGMALAAALGFAELGRRSGRGVRSGRAWFYFGVALFFSLATLQTVSRGAIVLTIGFWLGVVLLGLVWGWRRKVRGVVPAMAVFLVLVLGGGTGFILLNLTHGENRDFRSAWGATISQWEAGGDVSRIILNRVALRYHQANPIFGTGLGSWGYFYRQYVEPGEERVARVRRGWERDPQTRKLLRDEDGKRVPRYVPFQFWHTHNDWLQYLCELGWVGFVPLVLLLASPFWYGLRRQARRKGQGAGGRGSRGTVDSGQWTGDRGREAGVSEFRKPEAGVSEFQEPEAGARGFSPRVRKERMAGGVGGQGSGHKAQGASDKAQGASDRVQGASDKAQATSAKNEGQRTTNDEHPSTSFWTNRNFGLRFPKLRPAASPPSTLVLLAGIALIGVASLYEFPTRSPGLGLMLALLAGLVVMNGRLKVEG